MVDRFGARAVARGGGLIAAAGMGLALAVPTVPGTIAGFAAAGLGLATAVPAAMGLLVVPVAALAVVAAAGVLSGRRPTIR